MKVNHIEDADLKTLRNIMHRLYDAIRLTADERRDLAQVMDLILDRVETAEVDLKEHQDG